ncbi:metallophosphoesterase family protein [Mesorhizobium sp. SP-1A]|uniref:metallophosphoesterase family protein n=1 Tax=Mesorhizobium sp. SP-1A TaxID=3077840 RepID=UPI0028F6EB82|nr:metallophosphoesterase family protein [Mesorhizobium sp. SP-1A]
MSAGIHFREARAPQGVRLYAIGDVHGRLDLLKAMHRAIRDEIERDRPSDWRIVHLGDYIDRGPDSKGVIDHLIAAREREPRNIMLIGNHEVGLQNFLAMPDVNGLFVRNGGDATARSYGVELPPDPGDVARKALAAAVPPEHVDFLSSLAYTHEAGDFFFCHAGIRPGVPLDRQDPHDLVWIRDPFLSWPGLHPRLIVHGHTPVPRAEVLPNRVNLDSYAWRSGTLTALAVEGQAKRLITIGEGGAVQRREAVTP